MQQTMRLGHKGCSASKLCMQKRTTAIASRLNVFKAAETDAEKSGRVKEVESSQKSEDLRLNTTVMPLLMAAAPLDGLREYLQSQADYFNTLSLPEWLIHWGHPGNMAVVLFAMGGYGAAYLGWQIRLSNDQAVVMKAKQEHPKLALGMSIFFALGALGGMTSLLMQGKPIYESPHFVTGMAGLALLGVQATLPLLFSRNQNLRTAHAYLGTGVLALFLVHAGLGLKLGLGI